MNYTWAAQGEAADRAAAFAVRCTPPAMIARTRSLWTTRMIAAEAGVVCRFTAERGVTYRAGRYPRLTQRGGLWLSW